MGKSVAGFASLASLIAWIAACLWYPLTDSDIWWHLAAADWMHENRSLPRVDPFCLSSQGKPWIDLHWGFQVLAGSLWSLGGAKALVAAKVAAVAGAWLLALKPNLRPDNAWFLLPFAAFGIYHVRFYLDMRPLAFTLLGLAILYAATSAHLDGRLRRPWIILVPVQVLLANLQGLYPLGAFLVSCLWLGAWWERRSGGATRFPPLRPLGWTVVCLWLAGLATPYGWPGLVLPLSLLLRITPVPGNVFSSEIAENRPLTSLVRESLAAGHGFAGAAGSLLPWAILILAVLWTSLRARGRGSPGHALLFAGFALLGVMAQRNLPLLVLAGVMAAGRNLSVTQATAGREPAGSVKGRARRSAGAWMPALLVALVAALYGPRIRAAWRYELPGSLVTPFRFPIQGAEYLAAHPIPGNLFNELRFGGYLAWRLHPAKLPFVDGRMILRDAGFYREFLDAVDRPTGFPVYAERHGLTHALLPIGEDARFLPLAAHLLGRMGWYLLFADGASVLLAAPEAAGSLAMPLPAEALSPSDLAPEHPVNLALTRRFGSNPLLLDIARRNLENFLLAARDP